MPESSRRRPRRVTPAAAALLGYAPRVGPATATRAWPPWPQLHKTVTSYWLFLFSGKGGDPLYRSQGAQPIASTDRGRSPCARALAEDKRRAGCRAKEGPLLRSTRRGRDSRGSRSG